MNDFGLVTGATSGIGMEYVYELAKRKYNLIVVGRREELLKSLKKDLEKKYKIKVVYFKIDLSLEKDLKILENKIKKYDITFLVNAAGFGSGNFFTSTPLDFSKGMVNVHVLSTVTLCKVVLEKMILKNKGTIINISSIASYLTDPKSFALYNSTKSDVRVFSVTLQRELKLLKKNIKIQALTPGLVRTNFHMMRGGNTYNRYPEFMWMNVREVVGCSFKSLKKKKVICVPGFLNKIIVFILKIF